MVIKYGGYISETPPLPLYAITIARATYRRFRANYPRYVAHAFATSFVLSSVSRRERPTAEHVAWLAKVHAEALS